MTPRGNVGRKRHCPVCGSRKLVPSLGALSSQRTHRQPGDGVANVPFSWRCRTCMTSLRAVHAREGLWQRRRPLASWLFRQPSGIR